MQFATFFLAIVASAHAFSSPFIAHASSARRTSSPVALEASSRRQAVLGAGALFAAAALPTAAFADGTDDAMARIAAKNKAALVAEKEADRARIISQIEKDEETTEQKVQKIAGIAGAGIVLSVPLYYRNLARLFTKVTSGGADSGYATSAKKSAKAAPKGGGISAGTLGKAARSAFFKR